MIKIALSGWFTAPIPIMNNYASYLLPVYQYVHITFNAHPVTLITGVTTCHIHKIIITQSQHSTRQ